MSDGNGHRWTGWAFQNGHWRRLCSAHSRQQCLDQLAVEADIRRVPDNLTTVTANGHPPACRPVPRATRGTP
jgi:hypothetical protein